MTALDDRLSVYRAIDAHIRELGPTYVGTALVEAAVVEAAVQLRRIGNSLEAIADTRVSIAVSLDRIAATLNHLQPSKPEPPLY